MTKTEAEEVLLDIFTEYLPKSVTKAVKKEIATEILRELGEAEALNLETDPDDAEEEPAADLDAVLDRQD